MKLRAIPIYAALFLASVTHAENMPPVPKFYRDALVEFTETVSKSCEKFAQASLALVWFKQAGVPASASKEIIDGYVKEGLHFDLAGLDRMPNKTVAEFDRFAQSYARDHMMKCVRFRFDTLAVNMEAAR